MASSGQAVVVRTLYRELLRSGKTRAVHLQRHAAPLPELLERVTEKTKIAKWTEDEDKLFDLTSTDKWTRVTMEMYGGNLSKAIRSRFDETLDAASKEAFEKWVEPSYGQRCC